MSDPAHEVLGLLMLAFDGLDLPGPIADRLRAAPAAGITLFRYLNVDSSEQVRALTGSIQAAAASGGWSADGPLLIAADQEGGQLQALGDATTAFPGSMALGAAGDPSLADRVGRATGLELRALGVNVAYAPVCDLATNPRNLSIGIRSFGSEPEPAGALVGAMTQGLRSAGVVTAAKHFPGLGDAGADSHHGLPVVKHSRTALDARELRPFRAAIAAGVDLVMSAHLAAPGLTGSSDVPATLSRAVMSDLLRGDLGFDGLAITDALDMAALPQAEGQVDAVLAALAAGVDLLLTAPDEVARLRIERGLDRATRDGRLDRRAVDVSRERLADLRRRLAVAEATHPRPGLEVVRSAEHLALAREVAGRALTLVRDDAGLLPLRLGAGARIAAVMPGPRDLTPADTSSTVAPGLAAALRRHVPAVTELVTSIAPDPAELAAIVAAVAGHDAIVVGTIAANVHAGQARLAEALLATGIPTVTVALRTPWDLAAYPAAPVNVCTFGLLPVSLEALADGLFGGASFPGRLPVDIAGIASPGHGLQR